jgi:hypothetical protein
VQLFLTIFVGSNRTLSVRIGLNRIEPNSNRHFKNSVEPNRTRTHFLKVQPNRTEPNRTRIGKVRFDSLSGRFYINRVAIGPSPSRTWYLRKTGHPVGLGPSQDCNWCIPNFRVCSLFEYTRSNISQKLRKFNEIVPYERRYFGLFSLGAVGSVFIFFCKTEPVKIHLLSLNYKEKNTGVLS